MTDTIKILYIDDYDLDRELVKDALEREHGGFQITEASNKKAFLQALASNEFDMVLSDFNIAGFEGLQVIKIVRDHNPTIPVVIVTGTGSEEIAVQAMQQGASDYVIKSPKHIRRLPQTILAAIEKKRLEKARENADLLLSQSEKRLKNLIRIIPSALLVYNIDKGIVEINAEAHHLLGITAEYIYGTKSDTPAWWLVDEQGTRVPIQDYPINRVLSRKSKIVNQVVGMVSQEQPIPKWLMINATPELDADGNITNVIVAFVDITEKIRTEKQLRQSHKMESLGTMAGGICHDFNNILSAILGFAELSIADVEEGTFLKNALNEILIAGKRAKKLVRRILAFSRQIEKSYKPMDATPIVQESIRLMRSILPASIHIADDIAPDSGSILSDPTQLHQIIINLCTNAGHALEEKGGTLEVSLGNVSFDETVREKYPDLKPGEYLRLSVCDSGGGIPADIIEKIFDPYFTTKNEGRGTGLGLSVVHGLVKSHGGHISVSSEVNKGTCFHVYFPQASKQKDIIQPSQETTILSGSERILVVDDERPILKALQLNLERLGYTVIIISSSVEALGTFIESPDAFDLIITDMAMPELAGDELARAIKAIRPDIPIILCTGFSYKTENQRLSTLPIDELLMKPVENKTLAKTVRRVLNDLRK